MGDKYSNQDHYAVLGFDPSTFPQAIAEGLAILGKENPTPEEARWIGSITKTLNQFAAQNPDASEEVRTEFTKDLILNKFLRKKYNELVREHHSDLSTHDNLSDAERQELDNKKAAMTDEARQEFEAQQQAEQKAREAAGHERMVEINRAWDVIGDPKRRADYDRARSMGTSYDPDEGMYSRRRQERDQEQEQQDWEKDWEETYRRYYNPPNFKEEVRWRMEFDKDLSDLFFHEADVSGENLSGANFVNGEGKAFISGSNFNDTNLTGATLTNAFINKSTFNNANLASATLTDARIYDSQFNNVNFEGINAQGTIFHDVELKGANFRNADLSNGGFSGSDLSGNVDASGANFNNVGFGSANLDGINLTNTNLSGAKLHNTQLTNATLSNTDFTGADFYRVNFTGTDLSGANLRNAKFQFSDLQTVIGLAGTAERPRDLTGTSFTYSDLAKLDLSHTNFTNADLSRANLNGATLTGINFTGTNLQGTRFEETNLSGMNLQGHNLTHTSFQNANLEGANLSGTTLERANLFGTNLTGADLKNANIGNAYWDESTQFNGADLSGATISQQSLSSSRRKLRGALNLDQVKILGEDGQEVTGGHFSNKGMYVPANATWQQKLGVFKDDHETVVGVGTGVGIVGVGAAALAKAKHDEKKLEQKAAEEGREVTMAEKADIKMRKVGSWAMMVVGAAYSAKKGYDGIKNR